MRNVCAWHGTWRSYVWYVTWNVWSLAHTATHCNTLQHTATHCNTLQHAAAHCSTLQHAATRCNTLQHAATCCSTLQHTATLDMWHETCDRSLSYVTHSYGWVTSRTNRDNMSYHTFHAVLRMWVLYETWLIHMNESRTRASVHTFHVTYHKLQIAITCLVIQSTQYYTIPETQYDNISMIMSRHSILSRVIAHHTHIPNTGARTRTSLRESILNISAQCTASRTRTSSILMHERATSLREYFLSISALSREHAYPQYWCTNAHRSHQHHFASTFSVLVLSILRTRTSLLLMHERTLPWYSLCGLLGQSWLKKPTVATDLILMCGRIVCSCRLNTATAHHTDVTSYRCAVACLNT